MAPFGHSHLTPSSLHCWRQCPALPWARPERRQRKEGSRGFPYRERPEVWSPKSASCRHKQALACRWAGNNKSLPKCIGVRDRIAGSGSAAARRGTRIIAAATESATRAQSTTSTVATRVEHRCRAERDVGAVGPTRGSLEASELVCLDSVGRLCLAIHIPGISTSALGTSSGAATLVVARALGCLLSSSSFGLCSS